MNDIIWTPGMTLDMVEEQVIKKAFRFYDGNKTRTAHSLDIAIRTLDNKLAKYNKVEKVETSHTKTDSGE